MVIDLQEIPIFALKYVYMPFAEQGFRCNSNSSGLQCIHISNVFYFQCILFYIFNVFFAVHHVFRMDYFKKKLLQKEVF